MKRMLLYLPVLCLIAGLVIPATAQKFEWVQSQAINYNLNVQMVRYTIATDPAGNVLQAGLLNYKSNTTPGMSGDVMLRKYDRSGSPVFMQTLTGNAVVRNIATYPNGDFLLAGAFRDSVRFGPAHKLTGTGTSQYFIAKFTLAGQVSWMRNLSATVTGMRDLTAVTVDTAGMLYLAFSGTTLNSFIKKFDAAGNDLQTIQQSRVRNITGIGVDAAGNIFAAGSCIESNATFAGQPFSNGGSLYNTYVVKYSPAGVPQWIQKVQDITCVNPELKVMPGGTAYLAGPLNGSFSFGTHTTQGKSWVYDFFLARLDSAGTFKWVREVPQTMTGDARQGYSNFLEVDQAGNAYLAGFMRNSVNWGNGIQNTGLGGTDLLVQKYDTAGTLVWSKSGGGTSIDEGHSVAVNRFGEVYLTGISRGPVTLDTIVHNFSTTNIYTILTKVSVPAVVSALPRNIGAKPAIRLFPIPAANYVRVELPGQANQPVQVSIISLTGQVMHQRTYLPLPGNRIRVEVGSLPRGLYLVRVQDGATHFLSRLLLQ